MSPWLATLRSRLAQAAGAVGFVAFAALSLTFGLAALAFVVGAALVASAVIGLRVWWLRRRMAQELETGNGRHQATVIEGEYRVVSRPRRR